MSSVIYSNPSKVNIERHYNVIYRNIAQINSTMDYFRVLECIDKLCNLVGQYEGETESIWCIGESNEFTLDALIVGAYWFLSDHHTGQASFSYQVLSNLGSIFSPGMSDGPGEGSSEQTVYELLEVKLKGE